MAERRSSASTPMPPRYSWPAPAPSRSNARCAFLSSTIRPSTCASRPARPSSRSTTRSRLKSIVASCRSRASRTAGSRSTAPAHATAPAVDAGPWVKALADYIDEHVAAFGETPDLFPPEGVDTLARASRAAYARIHPLLLERARRGLVRRIHGDLHLGNIVLLEGRPVLFDAIEFSPLIASGDVLYDLAF